MPDPQPGADPFVPVSAQQHAERIRQAVKYLNDVVRAAAEERVAASFETDMGDFLEATPLARLRARVWISL